MLRIRRRVGGRGRHLVTTSSDAPSYTSSMSSPSPGSHAPLLPHPPTPPPSSSESYPAAAAAYGCASPLAGYPSADPSPPPEKGSPDVNATAPTTLENGGFCTGDVRDAGTCDKASDGWNAAACGRRAAFPAGVSCSGQTGQNPSRMSQEKVGQLPAHARTRSCKPPPRPVPCLHAAQNAPRSQSWERGCVAGCAPRDRLTWRCLPARSPGRARRRGR